MGFAYVASGPLVRSSYRAAEVFLRGILRSGRGHAVDGHGVQTALDARMDVARREARRVATDMGEEEAVPPLAIPDGRGASGLLPVSSLVRR
jgi:lipoic acid synthetase